MTTYTNHVAALQIGFGEDTAISHIDISAEADGTRTVIATADPLGAAGFIVKNMRGTVLGDVTGGKGHPVKAADRPVFDAIVVALAA